MTSIHGYELDVDIQGVMLQVALDALARTAQLVLAVFSTCWIQELDIYKERHFLNSPNL